jgi:TonB family protein
MQWSGLILALTIASATLVSAIGPENPLGKSINSSKPQGGVVVKKLVTPTYPPIARQTGVQGDVSISLGIRPDGTVESASVVSGHVLLQQAALNSAQHSQYECRGCTEPVIPFLMSYTFRIQDEERGETKALPSALSEQTKPIPVEKQWQTHVLIVAQSFRIIDYGPDRWKVRSVKCLYLWKCGWKP